MNIKRVIINLIDNSRNYNYIINKKLNLKRYNS